LPQRDSQWRIARERRNRTLDDRAGVAQSEQTEVLAEELDRAAVQNLLQVGDGDAQHLLGDGLLDLAQPRGDRLIDELPLDRVLGVQDQLDRGAADSSRHQALDLLGDVRGDDQCRERLSTPDLGDRISTRVHSDRIDRLEQLVRVLGDIDLLVAEVDLSLAGSHLAEDRHPRLAGGTGKGEPDHQRDRDRIDDQQPDQQR